MPTQSRWRMATMCLDCPFQSSGPGLHLRKTLRRWRSILAGLRRGEYFMCHETTDETGNGTNLVCAGAILWQENHRCTSNYQRVCERLEYFRALRKRKEN